MNPTVKRVSLVPRFTTIVGATPRYTKFIDVRRYGSMNCVCWRSHGTGTSPSVSVQFEEPDDLLVWSSVGAAIAPPADQEVAARRELAKPWLRTKLTREGTGAVGKHVLPCRLSNKEITSRMTIDDHDPRFDS